MIIYTVSHDDCVWQVVEEVSCLAPSIFFVMRLRCVVMGEALLYVNVTVEVGTLGRQIMMCGNGGSIIVCECDCGSWYIG